MYCMNGGYEMSLTEQMQTYITRCRMLCSDDVGLNMPPLFRVQKISTTVAFSLIM